MGPCDFYLFPNLKKYIRGVRFSDASELIARVQDLLNGFSKEFYCDGIKQLKQRCERCIELQGDYVEKSQMILE